MPSRQQSPRQRLTKTWWNDNTVLTYFPAAVMLIPAYLRNIHLGSDTGVPPDTAFFVTGDGRRGDGRFRIHRHPGFSYHIRSQSQAVHTIVTTVDLRVPEMIDNPYLRNINC